MSFVRYSNRPPFYADDVGFATSRYIASEDPNIPTPRTRVDELVIKMLDHDPAKRPNLAEIMMSLKRIIVYDFPTSGDLRPLQRLRFNRAAPLHACIHSCMMQSLPIFKIDPGILPCPPRSAMPARASHFVSPTYGLSRLATEAWFVCIGTRHSYGNFRRLFTSVI